MSDSQTEGTQILTNNDSELTFLLRQKYTAKPLSTIKVVDSLISLGLDEQDKVRYHKDQWNEQDYSHQGIGKWLKTLHGDHLPKVTDVPESIQDKNTNVGN
jgi:hypothetical protein